MRAQGIPAKSASLFSAQNPLRKRTIHNQRCEYECIAPVLGRASILKVGSRARRARGNADFAKFPHMKKNAFTKQPRQKRAERLTRHRLFPAETNLANDVMHSADTPPNCSPQK